MAPSVVADRYFDAWNRRDPDAIAAVFADGGTYTDPIVPDGLDPSATGGYGEEGSRGLPRPGVRRSRSFRRASRRVGLRPSGS